MTIPVCLSCSFFWLEVLWIKSEVLQLLCKCSPRELYYRAHTNSRLCTSAHWQVLFLSHPLVSKETSVFRFSNFSFFFLPLILKWVQKTSQKWKISNQWVCMDKIIFINIKPLWSPPNLNTNGLQRVIYKKEWGKLLNPWFFLNRLR